MRTSKYLLYTMKHIPHYAESISYQYMLRAGLIRKSAVGLYTWLPNGLRVLQKIKKIIRYEMNKLGAIEISFPIMQTNTLWNKSNRLTQYGKELMKVYDRNNHCFILSPTYEEMVTNFIKNEIQSYKKLPIILYQIQTKFRDEIRPKLGIMRAREFIMKDAYSFHENKICMHTTYHKIYKTYMKIFKKMNIIFYPVKAESGIMGGEHSHEFQSLSKNGEDKIIIYNNINNKKKNEKNVTIDAKNIQYTKNNKKYTNINVIDYTNKKELKKQFCSMKTKTIKIFVIKTIINNKDQFIGLMIRGDHQLSFDNIKKISMFNLNKNKIVFASYKEIKKIIYKNDKINLTIPIIIDKNILLLYDIYPVVIINNIFFIKKIFNQNFQESKVYDIVENNNCNNIITIHNCIEIGHIFQIGKKYSKILDSKIKNINGNQEFIHMGCYGIGVTRLVTAIIEQNHDKKGIIWPINISPFHLLIIPINLHKCQKIKKISEQLYNECKKNHIEVLLEDRNERIGIIFNDANLIGIPNIIIINTNTIKNNTIEYQERKNLKNKKIININSIVNIILKKIK